MKRSPIVAGQEFGMLTTVERSGSSNDGHVKWLCRCACGAMTVKATNNLRSSRSVQSCGCEGKKAQITSHTKHGMRNSPEYQSWVSAKERCHNPSSKDYYRYGAAGIVMCEEWRNSFEVFFAQMGSRPAGTTLDRYPNQSGNYEPGNCRWATPIEQNRNRRTSVTVEWRGSKTALAVIAAELGITYGAAFMRFKRGKLHEIR